MSRPTPQNFRARASRMALELANLVRKVVFGATTGGQWGILGYETGDGTEGDGDEPIDVYQGLYVYARPVESDNAEGVMLSVGAQSQNGVVAALRNEDARRRYVAEHGELAAGECAIFNTLGTLRVHLGGSGTVSIENSNGAAVELALKSDVTAIVTAITNAVPVGGDGGAALQTSILSALTGIPAGTTVLKGE